MTIPDKRDGLLYFFGSIFAAFASYRMHIELIDVGVFPIFEALIDLHGRAPDQYRVLPYLLIEFIRNILELFSSVELSPKYPIIIFDALFLFLSSVLLAGMFSRLRIRLILIFLLLTYPFMMFDGYRPISSFILFLSSLTMLLCQQHTLPMRKLAFFLLLLTFSFTRADVALVLAVISFAYVSFNNLEKGLIVVIPIGIQLLLSRVLFPEAEYFSSVVMIMDNLGGRFLIGSPLSYLIIGLLICFWSEVAGFVSSAWRQRKQALIPLLSYCVLLFIIARPNETRLFLPLLPAVLLLLGDQQASEKQEAAGETM
ncbi:MAG: hypothetical protein HOF74_05900 [Gammaproteobacteria bacterium]|jgi:hypothetical protein|nr:hypothetical protein [Gammaproteobacteria bacterium]MBT3859345.1 hypothetical protein [Gammaproteobacteria bacterium]MBT3986870.1 hypothetical protein [Gammaproteobacteria bacterium]MBT4255805.1 hypothetical protein [Gammaproteobacteria bacterium]MBT4581941.1 hypothetical protein [Gammaproteobacteria bacterium]